VWLAYGERWHPVRLSVGLPYDLRTHPECGRPGEAPHPANARDFGVAGTDLGCQVKEPISGGTG